MTFKAYPIEFEIYDDMEEPIAKVKAFDESAANVEITGLVCAESWPELAEAENEALREFVEYIRRNGDTRLASMAIAALVRAGEVK